jgi:hypothetical protein
MKPVFVTLSLLLALVGTSPAAPPSLARTLLPTPARTVDTVNVCMSPTSYAYHSSDGCNGLNRCTHEVKALREAEAQKLGKRKCLKCW